MKVLTVKEYCSQKGHIQVVPAVRENKNGFPFVTFIDEDNKAENIYFSKKAAESVIAGQLIDSDMFKKYQIGFTLNAAGEERIKLIINSERLELSELL